MAIVITHPERGIFVGNAMGFGLWSMWDAGNQTSVATFESEEQAREYVQSWLEGNDEAQYGYSSVEAVDEYSATMDELRAAGLEPLLGDMLVSELANTPAMGHA